MRTPASNQKRDDTLPSLIVIALIFAVSFLDDPKLVPVWLAIVVNLFVGLGWVFILFRAERKKAQTADELERRISAEGHALAFQLSLAALIVAGQFERVHLIHLELRHAAIFLLVAMVIGPQIARRRYR